MIRKALDSTLFSKAVRVESPRHENRICFPHPKTPLSKMSSSLLAIGRR